MKKSILSLSPETIFIIYLECQDPQAQVNEILKINGLNVWDLVAIRKIVKNAALASLSAKGKKPKKKDNRFSVLKGADRVFDVSKICKKNIAITIK